MNSRPDDSESLAPSEIAWRLGPEAATALAAEADETNPTALAARLRRSFSSGRAAWLAGQIELRRRARVKFSRAARMYFTPRGLEQATDEVAAEYKSRRFPANEPVADLCCGVGGDLQSLAARASRAIAVDLDPWIAAIAVANCEAAGVSRQRVAGRAEAVAERHAREAAAWHVDPDRRAEDRRSVRPDQFSPSWAEVAALAVANPNGAVKLAPASALSDEWSERGEREWISSRGECRQQVLWLGALASAPGLRRATAVRAGREPRSLVGSPEEPFDVASRPGRFVIDPDAALLAARLVGAAAREWNAAALHADGAYVTSDEVRDDPLGVWFEVRDVLPLDAKKLRAYLRERNVGRLELKTRGADVKLDELRKRLALSGDGDAAVLIATRTPKGVRAILAERVNRGTAGD